MVPLSQASYAIAATTPLTTTRESPIRSCLCTENHRSAGPLADCIVQARWLTHGAEVTGLEPLWWRSRPVAGGRLRGQRHGVLLQGRNRNSSGIASVDLAIGIELPRCLLEDAETYPLKGTSARSTWRALGIGEEAPAKRLPAGWSTARQIGLGVPRPRSVAFRPATTRRAV